MEIKTLFELLMGLDGDQEITFLGCKGVIYRLDNPDGSYKIIVEENPKDVYTLFDEDIETLESFESRLTRLQMPDLVDEDELVAQGFDKPILLRELLDNENVPYRQYLMANPKGDYLILADAGNGWWSIIVDSRTLYGVSDEK